MLKTKWNVSNAKLIRLSHKIKNVPKEEQECHYNISKCDNVIYVSCSYTSKLIKLMKLPFFNVTEIIVNPDVSDINKLEFKDIISVNGTLPPKALVLHLKIGKIASEEVNNANDEVVYNA